MTETGEASENPSPRQVPLGADGEDLPEQVRVRRAKRERLLAEGRHPYPVTVARTTTLAEIRAAHPDLSPGDETDDVVGVAGRVVFQRNTGKLCFATLQEGDGTRLQVMLSLAGVGEEQLAAWKADVDLGDHVFVHGRVIASKRGELSVMADSWQIAAKALRPLPVLHKELSEEAPGPPALRRPHRPPGGAGRRPHAGGASSVPCVSPSTTAGFTRGRDADAAGRCTAGPRHGRSDTHATPSTLICTCGSHRSCILKRCVVGGIEQVFEINRNFRNEGADSTHSPEFAMLEAYEAYGYYDTVAELTRELVQSAALAVHGDTVVALSDGTEYDFGGTWEEITLYGALSRAIGEEIGPGTSMERLSEFAGGLGVEVLPHYGPGKLAEELFEHLVVPTLFAPTFVRDYPEETSPLTRSHRSIPGVAEKWDLYVRSFELATGYSELVDPVVQRERFVAQSLLAAKGDIEAMRLDEDFLRAMEYGMPPSGGMGMGLDRLLMAITGLGIRETILFPLVKPE